MKNMSKIAKFFLVCAVIFALGLVMTIGGCAAGGVDDFKKLAEDGGLSFGGEPADEGMTESDFEFSSIKATGNADLEFAGSKYYEKVLEDNEISGIEAKPGKVIVIYDKNKTAPSVKTDGDTLVIDAGKGDNEIHFNDNYFEPKVIVFCGDEELGSVSVSSEACDLEMMGVSFKTADLGMNAGDIDLKDIISGGLKIETDAGDIDIAGVLKGSTDVKSDAGSVEIDVFNGIAAYTMDLQSDAGEIKVGEEYIDGTSYTQKGGKDSITVRTEAGEIEVGDL